MAEIQCPNCGRQNSDELENCAYCQASLTAESSGGDDWISSLRQEDDLYREEEDQVDWPDLGEEPEPGSVEEERLERISSGPLGDSPSDPDQLAGPPPDALARHDQPDWLKEIIGSASEESGGAADPTEPSSEEEAADVPEGAPAEPPAASELPDWLSELASPELSEEPAGTEGGDEPEQLPAWLAALGEPDSDEEFEMIELPRPDEGRPFDEDAAAPADLPEGADIDWLEGFIDDAPGQAQGDAPEPDPESDSPDWLAGFVDDSAAAVPLIQPQPTEDIPSWFGRMPEPAREPAPGETESDLPPWLSEFENAGSEPGESGRFEAAAADQEQAEADFEAAGEPFRDPAPDAEPDWEPEPEPDAVPGWDPEPDPEEVPDWLVSALGQVEVDPEDVETMAPDTAELPAAFSADASMEEAEPDAGLQDWLDRFDQGSEPDSEFESEAEPDDSPEWLRDVNRVGTGDSGRGQREEEIPEWLQELNDQSGEFRMESEGADDSEVETDAIDWMPGAAESAAFEMLSDEEGIVSDLAPGELPEWLRAMRPIDATDPGVMESGEVDTGSFERIGPLAGLRGVLSAEPSAAQAGRPPSHSVRLQVTDAQQGKANQLQKMVLGETEAQPAGRRSILSEQRVLRYLIAGLLFLATMLANLIPVRMNDLPAKPPEMDALSPMISGLTPESAVLVVLDYQPGMTGELDAAAAGVLDHIMLQGARLALVSTTPTGPALGERLVRQVEAQHGYVPGLQYVNLGYLPGGATGLQLLANAPVSAAPVGYDDRPFWSLVDQPGGSPWAQPAMQGLAGLGDFGMTLLLSDDPEMVRRWVEQVGPVLQPGSLVVVASAQADPLVRPYLESGQVAALVSGLRGGAAYEGFLQREGPARAAWDGVAVGTLLAIVLILGAGTYNLYLVWGERELVRKGGSG